MESDDAWALLWAGWVASFIAAETIAIRSRNPEAPLSHQLRRVLGVRKQTVHHHLGQVAFAASASWLVWHLWRGVGRGE